MGYLLIKDYTWNYSLSTVTGYLKKPNTDSSSHKLLDGPSAHQEFEAFGLLSPCPGLYNEALRLHSLLQRCLQLTNAIMTEHSHSNAVMRLSTSGCRDGCYLELCIQSSPPRQQIVISDLTGLTGLIRFAPHCLEQLGLKRGDCSIGAHDAGICEATIQLLLLSSLVWSLRRSRSSTSCCNMQSQKKNIFKHPRQANEQSKNQA